MATDGQHQAKTAGLNTSETEEDVFLKEHIHRQSHKVLKCLPAMGPVIMLYLQSSHRRFQFIGDLEWLLLPPLVSGQCKLYMKKDYPDLFHQLGISR